MIINGLVEMHKASGKGSLPHFISLTAVSLTFGILDLSSLRRCKMGKMIQWGGKVFVSCNF